MGELRILLFVDSPDDRSAVLAEVRRGLSGAVGARIDRVSSLAELDERLMAGGFDAAISDFPLHWTEVTSLIARLKSERPFCPVLLYTADGDVELAAAAMRVGLDDYVVRSAESYARLPLAVEVALNRARGREAAAAADRAHRERATELEALLETIPAAVWVAHDPRARRISGNRSAHELLGVPLGRDLAAMPTGGPAGAPTNLSGAAERTVQSAAASRRPVLDQELEIVDRRGEARILYGSAVPLFTDAGSVRGALAAFVDITALRQAEIDNSRLYRELKAASETKDRFLAALSHELRTPLTPVLAIVSRHEHAAAPEPLSLHELAVIRRNLEREARLIEDLLAATNLARSALAGDAAKAGPGAAQATLDTLLATDPPDGGQADPILRHRQEPAPVEATEPAEPTAGTPRAHILLVEDHADSAEALAELLRSSGYQVTWAPDAEEALHLAESAPWRTAPDAPPFDLVLSDLGLPGMSGFDLMRRLSERFRLPGIALSGYGMSEDLRRSRESGFTNHLVKPVDIEALREAIAALADPPARRR